MSILSWLLESRSTVSDISTLANPSSAFLEYFGRRAKSGVRVGGDEPLRVSAIYRGLSIRSNSLAMLPFSIRKRKSGGFGSEEARNHWAAELIEQGISPEHTNFDFFKLLEHNRIFAGNAYAYKTLDGAGRVLNMRPINPNRIRAARLESGELYYLIQSKNGKEEPVPKDWIFHIHGSYSNDGITGVPLVELLAEAAGLSLAMEEHGARLFSNGARLGGILKHPKTFSSTEAARRVRESFEEANSGLGNAHRTALLEEGMDWVKVSLSAEEAQFLESRKFQVTEIARWLELQPHLLGDLDRATFSNIEQQGMEYVVYGMLPAVTAWEQRLRISLLSPSERKKYFFKFNVNALARADMNTRSTYYANGRQWGYLCADDIRELEDLDPLPEKKGQIFLQPVNMIEAGEEPEESEEKNDETLEQNPVLPPAEASAPPPPDKESQTPNLKKRRSIETLIANELDHLLKKEAIILRNFAKKRAKSSTFQDFCKEFDDFCETSQTTIERELTPFVLTYAEIEEISPVDAVEALRSYARTHVESNRDTCIKDDPEESFVEITKRCDYLSQQKELECGETGWLLTRLRVIT